MVGLADLRPVGAEGQRVPSEAIHRKLNTYSKGMRQKVAIAIAMAKDAKALLLDEPTSGLDPDASNEFATLLKALRAQGKAVLMATHDLFHAQETGTNLGIMKSGRLVESVAASQIDLLELQRLYLLHMRN